MKARIDSWKAYRYENTNGVSCPNRLTLEIKGRHFDSDAEIRIGGQKAFSVDKKNGRKIIAKFCFDDLLKVKTGPKRTVSVTNPDTDREKADKKINLDKINYGNFSSNDLDPETTEGVENIQRALVSLSFLEGQYVTGFYGPLTTAAVVEFQKSYDILQTGYVGPLTKARLEEELK